MAFYLFSSMYLTISPITFMFWITSSLISTPNSSSICMMISTASKLSAPRSFSKSASNVNLSASTFDKSHNDPANIPIDSAIFNNDFVFISTL